MMWCIVFVFLWLIMVMLFMLFMLVAGVSCVSIVFSCFLWFPLCYSVSVFILLICERPGVGVGLCLFLCVVVCYMSVSFCFVCGVWFVICDSVCLFLVWLMWLLVLYDMLVLSCCGVLFGVLRVCV